MIKNFFHGMTIFGYEYILDRLLTELIVSRINGDDINMLICNIRQANVFCRILQFVFLKDNGVFLW